MVLPVQNSSISVGWKTDVVVESGSANSAGNLIKTVKIWVHWISSCIVDGV